MSIASVRASVIAEIWSGNGAPTAGADTILTSQTNPLDAGSTPSNLLRTDRYEYVCKDNSNATITVTDEFDGTVYHWLWRPTVPDGRLIFYAFGHSPDVNAFSAGNLVIKALVEDGATVAGIIMPGDESSTANHNAFPSRTASLNLLRCFVESTIRGINQLEGEFDSFQMAGHSGGAWTTCLAAAVDTRIQRSWHNAGVLPLTVTESTRDWEQFLPGVDAICDYQDLILLGCDSGRQQRQSINMNDTCCFNRSVINVVGNVPHFELVKERGVALGCDFDYLFDYTGGHEVTAATRTEIVTFFDQPFGPTVSSATVDSAGTTLTLVFSESVTTDYTGFDVDGWTLSGGSGSGTNTIVFTISQVYSDESPALDYVSATGNVTGVTSSSTLGDLTDRAITNSSSVSPNPTVTTGAASSVSFTTATVAGEVTSEGRESVTERGVTWNTSTGPTTGDNTATSGTGSGSFSANLTSLPDNTLIYFRAYATNASGTSYGSEDTFTTLDDPVPTVTSIRFDDGNTRIRISFSEAVTGTTGFSVDTGTITYVSGSGTASYLFSFTGSPTTVSYTPGNVVDSLSQALATFSNTTIDPELIATSSDTAVAAVAKSAVGSVSGSVTG